MFESNILSHQHHIQDVIQLYSNLGYDLESSSGNTILKLNLKKFKRNWIY